MSKQDDIISVDLKSLVESHDSPFVVIDSEFRIVAVNHAYEQVYSVTESQIIGQKCHKISHGNDRPCYEEGEECPHRHVFNEKEPYVCAHVHCDSNHRIHQVRVSAYPLYDSNGNILLGECLEEITPLTEKTTGSERMVGESAMFLACVKQLNIAASSDAPALLQGETGTGKELAAEYIHQHSSRANKSFQIVDSTVLTESLFESEMFGHEKGSYTGNIGQREGLFELAEGGTIFLDEVGDLPLSQQAKLLRVLESGQFRRVGGNKTLTCDVRIICATNRHLWESVLAGTFREDLYYRIACLNIRLPSLRERLDDIPLLARNLLEGINRSMRCSYTLLQDAVEPLMGYQYPGNVRELRNILFIAATHSQNRKIDATLIEHAMNNLPQCNGNNGNNEHHGELDIDSAVVQQEQSASVPGTSPYAEQPMSMQEVESHHLKTLLERFNGNRRKVADALGVSERTIYRKLKKLGFT